MNYERIILELLNRVSILEEEVQKLKTFVDTKLCADESESEKHTDFSYDKTKYLFKGKKYGKNRLVLAIVTDYCEGHKGLSFKDLSTTFDKSLQGSRGVVRMLSDVMANYPDYKKRYFCSNDEIIHLVDGDCVVSTQWGSGNIDTFIRRAEVLGAIIERV